MTREEIENGSEDMVIDEIEPVNGERTEMNAVPDGFNATYLKVYYGNTYFLQF
jgi:hypothetical protein